VNVDSSGNIIVVKTLSGSANVAAEALDNLGWPEILGTIAGDNTIFIVARNENDTVEIAERIRRLTDQR
jgi:transcriptional regulator of arginine metabolism